MSAIFALFRGLHREPKLPYQRPGRASKPKYIVIVTPDTNPWIETMKPYMTKILSSNVLGAKTLALLSAAWAPNTTATFGNTIRRYFHLCDEYMLVPLAATLAHMARYVAWLGQLGTIKASSLQPYMAAVNGLF
jgi:hypothetical protein